MHTMLTKPKVYYSSQTANDLIDHLEEHGDTAAAGSVRVKTALASLQQMSAK